MNSASFLDSLKVRRSIYALSPTSDVPDETIIDIIKQAILHVPSPFNSQTTRCLVLLGNEHQKLWGTIGDTLKPAMPPEKWAFFSPKIQEYKNGYGSCVFFDDMTAWDTIEKNLGPDRWAAVSSMTEEWTQHSSGMYQYAVWTALSLTGLAGNLQHYKMPPVVSEIQRIWNVPSHWVLKAQLVFGTPTGGPRQQKTFEPVEEERMFVRKS